MLDLDYVPNRIIQDYIVDHNEDYLIQAIDDEERVTLLIIRDLLRLGWEVAFRRNRVSIAPPDSYDRQTVRDSMEIKRHEIIVKNRPWITKHLAFAQANLGNGPDVWKSEVRPIIEVCENQKQFDLFRIYRYFWSSPYSEYVGRRIKVIVRDDALPNKPVIGIAALGSSIIHIPDRDTWIGWDTQTRTQNIIYIMDAYVLGALPPYNYLLGGKLISYLLASNEIRRVFAEKYSSAITTITHRVANDLACIFTTSLYGRSSQYNRIKFGSRTVYKKVGNTKGYGSMHLTNETFEAMRALLLHRGIEVENRFGDGPSWRMRLIRSVGDILNFDSDFLLRHSFKRDIYSIPLAENSREYLRGVDTTLNYFDCPSDDLVEFWKTRWLIHRKTNPNVRQQVENFNKASFSIT